MNKPSFEDISTRAYHLWEKRGRPDDQESSVNCWLEAERELSESAEDDTQTAATREGRDERNKSKKRKQVQGGANDGADAEQETPITNLERALSPEERRDARHARHGTSDRSGYGDNAQVEHFLVLVNMKHVRIYDDAVRGNPQLVEAFEPEIGQGGYTDQDSDQAGRFGNGGGRGGRNVRGGSIDERLPMLEEQQRRVAKEAAAVITRHLKAHPNANWSYAAGPTLHSLVLKELHKDLLARKDHDIQKDLLNMPLPELVGHFAQKA